MRMIWWALAIATGAVPAAGAAPAEVGQPIPGAGNWRLEQRLPGVPQPVCTIRAEGPEANTTVLLNNRGRPVMFVGRGNEWHDLAGEAEASLSIDGAPPVTIEAMMVNNIVAVAPADELLQRMRGAQMLEWTFPFGRFRAGIAGLGTALEALSACTAALAR